MLSHQAIARPDLRLLVMSATLGGGLATQVAGLMGRALQPPPDQQSTNDGSGSQGPAVTSASPPAVPVVTSEGRSYPVQVVYLGGWLILRHVLYHAV